jgi:hypothetical protein
MTLIKRKKAGLKRLITKPLPLPTKEVIKAQPKEESKPIFKNKAHDEQLHKLIKAFGADITNIQSVPYDDSKYTQGEIREVKHPKRKKEIEEINQKLIDKYRKHGANFLPFKK